MKKINTVIVLALVVAAFLAGQFISPRPDKELREKFAEERKIYEDSLQSKELQIIVLSHIENKLKDKITKDSLRYVEEFKKSDDEIKRLKNKIVLIDFSKYRVDELDSVRAALYQHRRK